MSLKSSYDIMLLIRNYIQANTSLVVYGNQETKEEGVILYHASNETNQTKTMQTTLLDLVFVSDKGRLQNSITESESLYNLLDKNTSILLDESLDPCDPKAYMHLEIITDYYFTVDHDSERFYSPMTLKINST